MSNFIENGIDSIKIVKDNFDYQRWAKRMYKEASSVPTKEEIMQQIETFVKKATESFLISNDKEDLFHTRRTQFFQLKSFLEKRLKAKPKCSSLERKQYAEILIVLQRYLTYSYTELMVGVELCL